MPPNPVELWVTFGIFLACGSVVGLMAWLERRPRQGFNPRLIPTTPVLLVFGFLGLLALVHLLNLYGIHTGRGTGTGP
jgi:uncharacterized iron-regulated membrane protein